MGKKGRCCMDMARKAMGDKGDQCPKCGSTISRVMLVKSEFCARTGSWRFNKTFVDVCKCNSQEIYG